MEASLDTPVALTTVLYAALGLYAVAWQLAVAKVAAGRWVLGLAVALHVGWMAWRGVAIGFFPLTTKAESFSAMTLALAAVPLAAWHLERSYLVVQLTVTLVAGVTAASFPQALEPPGPMLRTAWYPAHVPLTFLAMATWLAAASAGVTWWRTKAPEWLRHCDRFALQGFGLWSASMICGGIWGVVAWGAAFMWDPKMIWSVILWFHYAAFVHLRMTPSLQPRAWVRPALASVGVVLMVIAYVGTSFFFGKSAHAF